VFIQLLVVSSHFPFLVLFVDPVLGLLNISLFELSEVIV
jgi:hypothetical protein